MKTYAHFAVVFGVLALALTALSAVRCSAEEQMEPAMTPSQILRNPQKYDGKRVVVRGYLQIAPENRNLWDSKQAKEANTENACLGLYAPDVKFKRPTLVYERPSVTVSGIFRSRLCGPNDVCLFWCDNAGIELDPGVKLIE
jgi:hypothetical protein